MAAAERKDIQAEIARRRASWDTCRVGYGRAANGTKIVQVTVDAAEWAAKGDGKPLPEPLPEWTEPERAGDAESPITETVTTNYPACPYCGYVWDDWYHSGSCDESDGPVTTICASCEREYEVEWYTETTFTTTAAGEDATDKQE
jgi:hypothetical protein